MQLAESYLFSKVARCVADYRASHPGVELIRMGIGDVTRPICPAAVEALHRAADDEASAETFRGYGPEQGYDFLRRAIAENDYRQRGISIDDDEIFISDGAKSDTGNIGDILSCDNRVAVTDPVYPVYVDTNIMGGRHSIEYLPCTAANGFVPPFPTTSPDIVYLCYPNNPTGTTLTRDRLEGWVRWCRANGALLLFDSAYEAYITEPDVPRSIYEIQGAREVAIEFRSFSKTAGFTGLRLGYTVIPKELTGIDRNGNRVPLHRLWLRRQTTKFNGASYLSQRAAEALYSHEGQRQVAETITYYMTNAAIMRQGLAQARFESVGGVNSPYLWIKAPEGMTSWEFFDLLMDRYHIIGTPGSGFGAAGKGYLRLTAFSSRSDTEAAMNRLITIN